MRLESSRTRTRILDYCIVRAAAGKMCVLERRRAAAGRSSLTPGIHISLRLSSGFLSFRNLVFFLPFSVYITKLAF